MNLLVILNNLLILSKLIPVDDKEMTVTKCEN